MDGYHPLENTDRMYQTVAVIIAVAVVAVAVCWAAAALIDECNREDVAVGRWMGDAAFRARWAMPLGAGLRSMHVPGVVCVLAAAELDGSGVPASCADALVIIADDVTRVARDALLGLIDGQPFGYGAATLAMWKRLGNPECLARELCARYGAAGAYVICHRRRRFVAAGDLAAHAPVSAPSARRAAHAR